MSQTSTDSERWSEISQSYPSIGYSDEQNWLLHIDVSHNLDSYQDYAAPGADFGWHIEDQALLCPQILPETSSPIDSEVYPIGGHTDFYVSEFYGTDMPCVTPVLPGGEYTQIPGFTRASRMISSTLQAKKQGERKQFQKVAGPKSYGHRNHSFQVERSTPKPTKAGRQPHYVVERRYRDNLNTKIEELRSALKKSQANHDRPSATKMRKVDILIEALEYINQSQVDMHQMASEISRLKAQVHAPNQRCCNDCSMSENGVKIEDQSLSFDEWKMMQTRIIVR